jgi:hypothetical protein
MALSVDSAGSAFVAGSTASHTFPTTAGAMQRNLAGTSAAFFSRLNQQGSALLYSTLLSGSGSDAANAIALDRDGNVYVAGNTESKNFPVKHALHGTLDGQGSAFVAKFAGVPLVPTGSLTPPNLNFSTAFGTTSAPQVSTLKNVGSTSMTLSSIALGGANPGDFAFVTPPPSGACANTTVLAVKATCTINVVFTPTTFGGRNASVTVTSNANNSPEVLGLSGQGTGSFVTLTPPTLTFLNQRPVRRVLPRPLP